MFHHRAPRVPGAEPTRVGRSFLQLGAALRVAGTMSRQKFDFVEIRDDANNLVAYAHKGVVTLLNETLTPTQENPHAELV